jgi:hypothetical protein
MPVPPNHSHYPLDALLQKYFQEKVHNQPEIITWRMVCEMVEHVEDRSQESFQGIWGLDTW